MKTKKPLAIVLVLLASIALLAAGCTTNTPSPTPYLTLTPALTITPMVTPMTTPMTTPMITMTPGTTPGASMSNLMGGDEATKIAAEVDKLSEIEKSTVVLSGDNALIGVQFTAQYKGELTDRIKEMVAEKAKAADSRIASVAVTADPDMVTRITAIFDGIKTGNTQALGDEFSEIFNRLAPKVS